MDRSRKVVKRIFALITLSLTIFCWFCPLSPSTSMGFVVLTLSVPSSRIPLPLQLVLAYGWKLQAEKESISYPWWTLGVFGVTFVTDDENVDKLKSLLSQVWRQTDWDPLVVRKARLLASQQIRAWKREPMEWLRWQARLIALGDHPKNLDPEQPSRVRLDDVSVILRKLSRYQLTLLHYDLTSQSWSFTVFAENLPTIRPKFQQTLRFPSSQRTHGLWWTVAKGDPLVAMVVGELLGGGTGAEWYQLLRGEKPVAYHAVAQVQWTPFGSELTLYAATTPENLKFARQRAQKLLLNLSQGKIEGLEFERARKLAELRFKQMTSDPINLSRVKAIWCMSGRSLSEWENLSEKLQSLSISDLHAFCRSLLPTAEVIALP